ncbi:MAG: hypothetical protein JWQ74_2445 [Marmoricola sp.]|nr:hypothetical protein [Marmoricola sp.]
MRVRRRVLAVVIAMSLALLVVGGTRLWDRLHRTPLQDAVAVVMGDAKVFSFTDWAQVRKQIGVPTTSSASEADIAKLAQRGYDTDLTAASSIDGSTAALQTYFGFSPMSMLWEVYSKTLDGSAMVVRMPDDFDFGQVRSKLTSSGFTKPSSSEGVWKGGVDLVAKLDPTLTPELQYVAVLADKHLIVTSDGEKYMTRAVAAALGNKRSLGDTASARDLVAEAGKPVAASVWAGDFACTDLAMSQASVDDQATASALIAKAGKVSPLSGMVMSLAADSTLSVVQLFEDADQAKENLRARSRLAVGEAVGRGGSFSDDLTLTSSRTEGAAVLLRWKPKDPTSFPLSGLDTGPVVFATC